MAPVAGGPDRHIRFGRCAVPCRRVRGNHERWADTAGGPNGALLIEGNGILVAQNGGLDVSRFRPGPVSPVRPSAPGLQLVESDGSVGSVQTDQLLFSPNDLAVDADGSVVFTDVLHDSEWSRLTGRLWRMMPDGTITLLEDVPHYLNGVSASPQGLLTADGPDCAVCAREIAVGFRTIAGAWTALP